jgi:2'-5' RNA ligase
LTDNTLTRCFLACWPDQHLSHELKNLADRVREQSGGRVTPQQNIHITLAFLGDLIPAQVQAVETSCPNLPEVFTMTLDRIGYWRNTGIVWAGSRNPDPEFIEFVEGLRYVLHRMGFRTDQRAFVPHLTLVRKAHKRPRLALESWNWRIGEYQLVASERSAKGSRYSTLKRWSIKGDVK